MLNTIAILVFAGAGLFIGGRWAAKRRRREALLAAPLPPEHRAIISRRVPLYRKLPDTMRARLDGLINRFLDEIKFVGCDGFVVTEEARLMIAAQACLLIMNRPHHWYPTLKSVLVYPAAFRSKRRTIDGIFESDESPVHVGESWMRGPVVLAWDHAVYGALVDRDGHNVVLHEFAHQLDEATGYSDGAPLLNKEHNAGHWARVFQYSYEHLQRKVRKGKPSVFDPYGSITPAEFFAVAVETFFEKPEQMKMEEPKVYKELSVYFGIDPASW